MKPVLHRSIIFWAGILVIAFTCWAWWDSYRKVAAIEVWQIAAVSANQGIMISRNTGNGFAFNVGRRPPTRPPNTPPYLAPFLVHSRGYTVNELPSPSLDTKELKQFHVDRLLPGSWFLYLPYWLIVLALLIPWSLLLLWRARRLKRAHALTDPS